MEYFKYVSCIKIAGAPILPPLVSDKDREILALYKHEAIQKEKELAWNKAKLETSKTTEITDEELLSYNSTNLDSYNSLETEKVMEFIRQALHDVGPADVKLLQAKILEEMQNIKMPDLNRSASCDTLHFLEDISMTEDKESFEHPMESCQILKELSSDKIYSERETTPEQHIHKKELSKSLPGSLKLDDIGVDSKSPCELSQKFSEENMNTSNVTPPKLIRRNSYTLDSPSPSVLLYLKSKCHSDASSLEIYNEKRVVRNLNHYWDSKEEYKQSHESDTSCLGSVSGYNSSSLSPSGICDNHQVFGEKSDANSNLCKEGTIANYEGKESYQKTIPVIKPKRKTNELVDNVSLERTKAIVTIQAGIRGYLVRRLMKTNKIIELRNTIKDSLICALALHSEQNVSSADVNLHVRLIRQVTAACYELHAIFFEYSLQERMHLISLDREKVLSAERARLNLRRLKEIKSDDESSKNSLQNSPKGKPKRPSSLPLNKRESPASKPWR